MTTMTTGISILKETNQFLVIDKPAGLSVHNEDHSQSSVLKELGGKLHLGHRLDKETSGLLILAKSSAAAATLMKSLSEKSSAKFYTAILRGDLNKLTPEGRLLWNWPITDKSEGRQNPQGKTQDRLASETQVEILQRNSYFTQIRAQILTGRQHQIRKHAALAKHPIVGDPRYNDKSYNSKMFSRYHFDRMLLHAENMRFSFNDEWFDLTAPRPAIFNMLFNSELGGR